MSKKIFIDTNKFLDFYRYKDENMEILTELEKCNNIILVEQVIDEFKRNRIKEIKNLSETINKVKNDIKNNMFRIDPIGIYNETMKEINNYTSSKTTEIKQEIGKFKEKIDNIISDDSLDIVYSVFKNIINNNKTIIYKHDDECYKNAIKRNNLGGVPRSDKNGFKSLTVCDEYIWETLLKNSKHDICFVTRDKTYLDNSNILEEEYNKLTNKKICFVETISDGLEYLGNEISEYAKELDKINSFEIEEESKEFDSELKMTEGQQKILTYAMDLVEKSKSDIQKQVLIIKGSAGTGKTFLARNIFLSLINKSYRVTFVTKSSTSRRLFYEQLKGDYKQKYLETLIKGAGSFYKNELNDYDCLIVDDASRLQEKSGIFQNKGENQIKEIINSSKISIFLIDENQRLNINEIGSIEKIEKISNELKCKINIINLDNSLNYNTKNQYLNWLEYVLQLKDEKQNYDFEFDFKVVDDPNELRNLIVEKNKINNNSRIVAGYCWNWISDGKNNSDIHDIVIPEYNFEMSWNLLNENSWPFDKDSINEVGCIHTCQGINFDYVGVIIGDDMRYENSKIITDYTKRAKTDQSMKGINRLMKDNPSEAKRLADNIIKGTYYTLLSRGKKGCYVFCTNKELREYLKQQLIKKY